ncbi:hypothetical protein C8J57DRAFT_202176 [Mycena rebaudengoi]|nr:hypothetical protein C8J57DRAFT_202176 [Mycena rebaudengoi]
MQYAPGNTTTTYAPGTSSPTPQYTATQYTTLGATPRTLTARYDTWGGRRGARGSRTSTSTLSRRRPCHPRPHPRAPPRPSRAPPRRSRLLRRRRRVRRRRDTTPRLHGAHHRLRNATRRRLRDATHPRRRLRTAPRAYLSSPRRTTGASRTRGMRRWCMCLGPPRPASYTPRPNTPTIMPPSTTPAAATRTPRPRSRRDGCAGCASSLPTPPHPRTGRSSRRSSCNLSMVPRRRRVRGAVGRADRAAVAGAGEKVVAEVLGGGAEDGGVSGWGTAAAVDAPDAARDAHPLAHAPRARRRRCRAAPCLRTRARRR